MKLVKILLVEDDQDFGRSFSLVLKRKGYVVVLEASAPLALSRLEEERFDLIISDVVMPQMNGLDFVRTLKDKNGLEIPIIMVSGYGSVKEAVEAMKLGAYNYFLKPINQDEICLTIEKALEYNKLRQENALLRGELLAVKGQMLDSANPRMRSLLDEARTLAASDVNILLAGESGTGKEVLARYIHAASCRSKGAFVAMNCQAYAASLLESELFGYRGGAFTGAQAKGKRGKIELSHGGTLFLDEIGEIEAPTQVKLLRVLENREIEPLGGTKAISVNFRLLSATNRNLEQAVAQKLFRDDLYYRINTVVLSLPPLRERMEDILPLAKHFLKLFAAEQKKTIARFSAGAEQALCNYGWPGNIRELKNVIEGAVALSRGTRIEESQLRIAGKKPLLSCFHGMCFAEAKKRFERVFWAEAYAQVDGNISALSRMVQLDRKQVYKKLTEHGLLLGKDDRLEYASCVSAQKKEV